MLSKEKNHLRSLAAQTKFQVWLRRQQHLKQWHQWHQWHHWVSSNLHRSKNRHQCWKKVPSHRKPRHPRQCQHPVHQQHKHLHRPRWPVHPVHQLSQCPVQHQLNQCQSQRTPHMTQWCTYLTLHLCSVCHAFLDDWRTTNIGIFLWCESALLSFLWLSFWNCKQFFLTQAGNPPGLRGVCICDQSLLWTGQHGRWQSASSEDPVLQLQLLTQKSIELVQLFTSLFGLHYFIFLIKAIDCLRSRLLIKKDKGIDNWLMNAVRPLPA